MLLTALGADEEEAIPLLGSSGGAVKRNSSQFCNRLVKPSKALPRDKAPHFCKGNVLPQPHQPPLLSLPLPSMLVPKWQTPFPPSFLGHRNRGTCPEGILLSPAICQLSVLPSLLRCLELAVGRGALKLPDFVQVIS